MNTLLLRLGGAMQSWGVQSRFGVRDTGREPSKRGVIGLICAAMGIPREDDAALAELAQFRMGVRVDREGSLKVDYHTAQNVLKAGGGIKEPELSSRYYLADALFLVGLSGENIPLLDRMNTPLRAAVWPLFLGRKSFVPGSPVWLENGLQEDTSLIDALRAYPILGGNSDGHPMRVILEDQSGTVVRADQPISFSSRRFTQRRLKVDFIPAPVQRVEAS